ncbi:MAG: caspase family protein [Candidatus Obscuribacterales bacterium]|nr:caspase family protein [Candidatus Obscuribacterales bacterium]
MPDAHPENLSFYSRLRLSLFCILIIIGLGFPVQSASAQESSERPIRDKWAVVIGISKFLKPELDLKTAENDAVSFRNYLVEKAGFAEDHVKLLCNENASRSKILSTLGNSWLCRAAGPEDLVVIFISSHGSAPDSDSEGTNYLLASDSDPDDLFSSGIDMQALAKMIKARVHSNRVVFVLDTCYSGAASKGSKGLLRKANVDADKFSQSSGQIVLASSLANQISWESADHKNSVFTRCLIDGLQIKSEATTLNEAFAFLKDKVETIVLQERGELQNPVLKGAQAAATICLAAKVTEARSAPEDEFSKAKNNSPRLTASPQASSSQERSVISAELKEQLLLLPFIEGNDSGTSMPDFEGLPVILEELVRFQLASSPISNQVMSPYEIGSILGKTGLNGIWTIEARKTLGKAARAKYIARVNLLSASFDNEGKVDCSVSVRVASGETGDYIWCGSTKADGFSCQGDKNSRLQYLRRNVLPYLSKYISRALIATVSAK